MGGDRVLSVPRPGVAELLSAVPVGGDGRVDGWMFVQVLRKWGPKKSHAVSVPARVVRELGLAPGDRVLVVVCRAPPGAEPVPARTRTLCPVCGKAARRHLRTLKGGVRVAYYYHKDGSPSHRVVLSGG